jgi:hypothetical protein
LKKLLQVISSTNDKLTSMAEPTNRRCKTSEHCEVCELWWPGGDSVKEAANDSTTTEQSAAQSCNLQLYVNAMCIQGMHCDLACMQSKHSCCCYFAAALMICKAGPAAAAATHVTGDAYATPREFSGS